MLVGRTLLLCCTCDYILICGYVIDAVRGYVVVELRAVPDNVAAMRTLSTKLVSLGRVYGCSDRYFPLGNDRTRYTTSAWRRLRTHRRVVAPLSNDIA